MEQERRLMDDVRDALPAVVQILAEGYDAADIRSLLNPRYLLPAEWGGSGFFIEVDGEAGYILTNSHVVTNARKLKIRTMLTSEELFTVDVVGNVLLGEPDIALLKLPDAELERFLTQTGGILPTLPLADSTEVKRGMRVKAIGYPFGMPEPNISGGEVSNFLAGDAYSAERLVTDAAINPGNSGGPTLIRGGEVIGINTAIIVNANNIGFITPIKFFRILLPAFLSKLQPGLTSLAARFQPNSEAMAKHFGQERPDGLIVSRLVPGGMLARAGLQRGDVLLSLAGQPIDRYGNSAVARQGRKVNILDISRELPLGQEIDLSIWRDGQELGLSTLTIPIPTFGIRSQPAMEQRHFIYAGGMIIQELSYEIVDALSGTFNEDYWKEIEASQYTERPLLVVTDIESDSQADYLFLEVGEIIVAVNDQPFDGSLNDLASLLKKLRSEERDELLLEFRSGSYGCFSLSHDFDDVSVKPCSTE